MIETLIALETSGPRCGVALWSRVVAGFPEITHSIHNGAQEHAARLLPMVSQQLESAGLQPSNLSAVAFSQGPGAFTGLRVACGVARGIGLSLDVPVIGVSTHAAVADTVERLVEPQIVAVAMDARIMEIYVTVLLLPGKREAGNTLVLRSNQQAASARDRDMKVDATLGASLLHWAAPAPEILAGPLLIAVADLPIWLSKGREGWLLRGTGANLAWLAGDAWAAYGKQLVWPAGWTLHTTQAPSVTRVARLGALAWHAGKGRDANDSRLVYVRDKVAFTVAERATGLGGNPKVTSTISTNAK